MSAARSELEQFLTQRIISCDSSWVGISSDAMVAEAVSGRDVDDWDYPRDLADLSRCCVTFARAPWDIKKLMLPRLIDFCQHVASSDGAI